MSALALNLPNDSPASSPAELRRALAEQVARLPALQARAFRLRELEGWTTARICRQLGVSDEVLAELLFEARVAMCRALAPEGLPRPR